MNNRERTDAGTFVETVTLEAVRSVFDEVRGPVITSSDVSDSLGCTTEAARQKLRRLVDQGEVHRRKTGRIVVYWRPSNESRRETAANTARDDLSGKVGGSPETTLDTESDELDTQDTPTIDDGLPNKKVNMETTADDTLAEDVRAHLKDNDIPPKTQHGREAVVDIFRYLREHGTAKTGEIKSALVPKHGDRYSNKKAMWESVRRYLEDIPGIEKQGRGKYGYASDEAVRDQLIGGENGIYDPTEEF